MTRLLTPQAYGALKGATAAALSIATPNGSAEAFASLTRVEPRTIRKYADHADDMFMPLDIAADLDRAAGRPILASALAALSGGTVTVLAAADEASALKAIKETGEAVAAIATLASSGAWGLEQAKAARAEVRDALAALAGLDGELTKRIEGSS